jgi:eukaryotic-like serine/threonine-protein kinase
MTLKRGDILNKRYRIVGILGQGGMGAIYRAVDENLGIDVAVKENLFTTEEFARQFHREAIILANLRHPNLPRVTDHFVIEGQGQYLIMDYIEGENLSERIDRIGPLKEDEVVILGVAMCEALIYLHSRQPQVVHRDIKPGNVKITPSGSICLVDFGLAKVVEEEQITSTGARAMTPGYSPPEQYGTARTDHRTDIYSLGATLYVALTGVIPEDALERVMGQSKLSPIRKHNKEVPRRMAAAIEKAMALRPEDRYHSVEHFKHALINSQSIDAVIPVDDLVLSPPPLVGNHDSYKDVRKDQSRDGAKDEFDVRLSMEGEASQAISGYSKSKPLFKFEEKKRRWKIVLGVTMILLLLMVLATTWVNLNQPSMMASALDSIAPLLGVRQINGSSPGMALVTETSLVSETMTATHTAHHTQPPPTEVIPNVEEATSTIMPPVIEFTQTLTPSPTPTPTMTSTAFGGGLGQIAYASNISGVPQIWIVNIDGTGQNQITNMPEGACQPDWAPDGTRLVFISPCSSNQEIYPGASLFIIDKDGSNLTPLPTMPGGDFDPAWSPDGETIAFTSLRDYNRPQIYAIRLLDYSIIPISNNLVRDLQPSWSKDGEKIAFITTRRGPSQVWTMKSDGSDPVLLSRSGDKKNSHPVWSPDSQVILFTQTEVFGGVPRLIAIRIVEGTPTENRVVRDLTPMRQAVYSPDGFWIAYEGWPDGDSHNIYIMTTNGLARQQLTTEDGYDFHPAWRPILSDP